MWIFDIITCETKLFNLYFPALLIPVKVFVLAAIRRFWFLLRFLYLPRCFVSQFRLVMHFLVTVMQAPYTVKQVCTLHTPTRLSASWEGLNRSPAQSAAVLCWPKFALIEQIIRFLQLFYFCQKLGFWAILFGPETLETQSIALQIQIIA